MATLPIDEPFMTVEEYLGTTYRPDCEYVDGRIEERNLGEKEHSLLQRYFIFLFMLNAVQWGVEVFPELRTQVARTRFRVPDVLVVRAGVSFERILEVPPLIAIEILSPKDRLSDLQVRVNDYLAFGTSNIWILDPERRMAWFADGDGLHLVIDGELRVPGTEIRVVLIEAWAELERHS